MHDLQIALDVSLIEQTPPHLQMSPQSFCHGVRQLVRILNRAYQLTDTYEHVETILGESLFVDVLYDDDHAAHFIRLVAKRNTEHARPDLFAIGSGVEHFAAGTD